MCHSMSRGRTGPQPARHRPERRVQAGSPGEAAGAVAAEVCGWAQRFGMGLQVRRENESRRVDGGGPILVRPSRRQVCNAR